MKKPDYRKAMQQKNRQASNVTRIKSNVPDMPDVPPPPASSSEPQPAKAPVDPSTLSDGVYSFKVIGGDLVKQGNDGMVILHFRFIHPDMAGTDLNIQIAKLQLGAIVSPGHGKRISSGLINFPTQ